MKTLMISGWLALWAVFCNAQKPWEHLSERLWRGDMPFLADPVTSDPDSASMGILQELWPAQDIALLQRYRGKLKPLIFDNLTRHQGADESWLYLAAYLRYRKSRSYLRDHLLGGERFYGWEGTDTTLLEPYYVDDQQYPSAMMHLALARWVSGKQKGSPIRIGPYWANRLRVMASWCSKENTEACYYRWLQAKLDL